MTDLDTPNLMPHWAVVCDQTYYAGQGVSFERGDLRDTTITREEADAICAAMNTGWDAGNWTVMPWEQYERDWREKNRCTRLARLDRAAKDHP